MTIEAGTVSFGTLRVKDLIISFLYEILYQDPNNEFADHLFSTIEYATEEYWESEEATFDLEELFDILDGMAPEGMYFGAHYGDPADFGFWYTE